MRRFVIAALSLAVMSAYSCTTIHEFPDGEGVDPTLIDVDLSVLINMDLNDEDPIIQTYSDMLKEDYDIRYIVEIYKVSDSYAETVGSLVKRIERVESTVIENGVYNVDEDVQLHAGVYSVMVWMDFIRKGTGSDYFYDTSNLHEIKVNMIDGEYWGYDTAKDAFSAQETMDLTPFADERFADYSLEVQVKRPFAVYKVIANDVKDYTGAEPSLTKAGYGLYFPMGYNVYYSVPDNFVTGVEYQYDPYLSSEPEEMVIASDFVFVNDKDTFYYLNMTVYDRNGDPVSTAKDIKINLERNRMTIVKGAFLTKDVDNGQVGIDPGFDDEIIVPIG